MTASPCLSVALKIVVLLGMTGPATAREPRTVADLVEAAKSWVVALRVERTKDLPRSRFEPRRLPRELRDYFRRPAEPVSGLLLDREGHVLTSHYNIGGDIKSIRVVLPDGSDREARLLAGDTSDDLALLRLEGDIGELLGPEWTGPSWAEEPPRPGQILLAVGRSPSLRHLTVTQGIVSAGGRNGQRRLQTDAKLNYGNVGGPLLDLDGRVAAVSGFVGHIHPQWGFNSGIGFGTTAAVVREVLPRMKRGEDVELEFPFLGIESSRAETGSRGAVVTRILEGYPAAKAGILVDDIITEFAGEPLTSFNELRQLIARHRVGDVVTVKVRRGKAVLDLEVKLGKRPRLR